MFGLPHLERTLKGGRGACIAGMAIAAAISTTSCGAPVTEVTISFGGSHVNAALWHPCYPAVSAQGGCTSFGNPNEREWYVASQDVVSRGALELVAVRRATAGLSADGSAKLYDYASGMVTSHFSFLYGRIAIVARIPARPGTWPALWLLPADARSQPEIDIMENWGKPNQVQCTLHWMSKNNTEQSASEVVTTATSLAAGWHSYSVDWTPRVLTWSVDNKVVFRYKGPGVPNTPTYLIANLAIDGEAATGTTFFIKSVSVRSSDFHLNGTYR